MNTDIFFKFFMGAAILGLITAVLSFFIRRDRPNNTFNNWNF